MIKKRWFGLILLVGFLGGIVIPVSVFASSPSLTISGSDLVLNLGSNVSTRIAIGSPSYITNTYVNPASSHTFSNLVNSASLANGTYYVYSANDLSWGGCGSGDNCNSTSAPYVETFYVRDGALSLTPPSTAPVLNTAFVGSIGTNLVSGSSGTGTGVLGGWASSFHNYGVALIALLSALLGVMVAWLIFKFGKKQVWNSLNGGTSSSPAVPHSSSVYNAYGSGSGKYLSQAEISAQFPAMHD